jgi:hypothetical protein
MGSVESTVTKSAKGGDRGLRQLFCGLRHIERGAEARARVVRQFQAPPVRIVGAQGHADKSFSTLISHASQAEYHISDIHPKRFSIPSTLRP